MSALYKKFISISTLFAVFLFWNMAIVHALAERTHKEIISHTHDNIIESHVVETTDSKEPPHCTQTKIDTGIAQQVRDTVDLPDVLRVITSLYSEYDEKVEPLIQDTYFQHYPWSENHFFWHLLIGEQILMI